MGYLNTKLYKHQFFDYYKTIDADGALFYWNEFDKEDDR